MAIQEAPPRQKCPPQDVDLDRGIPIDGAGIAPPPIPAPGTSHQPPGSRRSLPLLALAGLLVLLLIAGSALIANRLISPTPAPNALHANSSVISVRTSGGGSLVLRTASGAFDYVAMARKRLLTQDSQPLDLASVRVGDGLVMRSPRVLVDTAQTQVSVQGITASSPSPEGDVMTVQVTPGRTILVDLSPQTLINGKQPSVDSRMAIRVADPVRIVGILDRTLDEVTHTRTIRVSSPR